MNEIISLSFADNGTASILESNDGSIEAARANFTASANVKWGVIKRIEIEDPTDGTIDDPVEVTVYAKDNWGNIVKDFDNTDVVLKGNKNSTNSGTLNIDNGVAKRNISDSVNETIDLTLDLRDGVTELKNSLNEDVDISSTQDLYFKWGVATQFVLLDPSDGTVDNPITVEVQVKDQGNNLVKDYTGNIGVRVNQDAHHDSYLSGIRNKTIAFGGSTGKVTTQIYDQVAQVVTIELVDIDSTSFTLSSSQNVTFAPGVVTEFAYDTPSNVTVDAPANLTVKSLDQFGNHNQQYTEADAVSLRWVNQLSADTDPSGLTDIDFDSGVGTINVIDQVAEVIRVGLNSKSGYDTSSEIDIDFKPGVVRQIVIIPPIASSITTDNAATISLETQDQYGNHNTSYEEDITFLVNNSATVPVDLKEKNVDISSGVGTIDVSNQISETVTLSLRDDVVPNRGLILNPVDIFFNPGVPTQYRITSAPDGTADNPVSITIQAQDQYGNRATSHQDDVILNISQGTAAVFNTAPASDYEPDGSTNQNIQVNIINGQGSTFLVDRTAEVAKVYLSNEGSQSLNLFPSISDAHEEITFVHGTPTKYIFLPLAQTATTDNPFNIDVEAQDKWDNKATSFNGNVSVRVNKNAFIAETSDKVVQLDIANGGGTVSVEDSVVETGVVASLGNELGSNTASLDTSDTLLFNVTFGAPDYFAIVNPTADATTDAAAPVNVEVRDKNHNIITNGFNGDVDFVISPLSSAFVGSQGVQTVRLDFGNNGNGIETVMISDQTAEVVGLSLQAVTGQPVTNVTDKQNPLEVKQIRFKAGTVRQFELTATSCISVDNDCDVTIHAQDQYGNQNLEFGDSSAIKLAFNAGSSAYFVGTSDASFNSGESKVDIGDNVNETVTVSMSNQTGGTYTFVNTLDILFNYGVATKYNFRNPSATPTTDGPINIEIEALDQYNNLVANYGANSNQDVRVVINSGSDSVSGHGPVTNFTNGVGNLNISKTVVGEVVLGLQNLNDSLDVTDTLTLDFEHGVVNYLAYVPVNVDWSVDDTQSIRIEARDQNNNLCSTYGGSTKTVEVFFVSGGASATGNGTYQFANGFFEANLTNTVTETMTLGLRNPSDSVTVSNTTDVTWIAGAPTRLTVLPQSGPNYTVDDTPVIRIEAQDQYGNYADTYDGTATFTVNRNAYIFNASDPTNRTQKTESLDFSGSGGFVNVAIEDFTAENGVELSASSASDGIVNYTSAVVNFTHGVAQKYFLSSTDGTVDNPVDVNIEVHDRGGNVVQNMATHSIRLRTDRTTTTFDPASGEVSVINGVANLQLSDTVAEDVIITVDTAGDAPTPQTSTAGVNTTSTFAPGVVTQLVYVNTPASVTAGQQYTMSLEAHDQYGNLNTNYNTTFEFVDIDGVVDDGSFTMRSNNTVSIANGTASASVTSTVAENLRYYIGGMPLNNANGDPIDTSHNVAVVVNPDSPTDLVFMPISNDTVDNFIRIPIEVHDQFGNKVPSAANQVAEFTLSSASGQAQFTPPQDDLVSNVFTIQNGEGSFNLYNTVAENVTVGMRIPSSNPPNTTSLNLDSDVVVTFSPGVPTKYMIIPPASSTVVDTPSFKVVVQDQYNNKVSSAGTSGSPGQVKINATISGGTVDITHNSTTTSPNAELDIVNGEATVELNTTKAGTAKIQLTSSDNTDPLNLTPDATIHDVFFDAGPTDYIAMIDPIDATVDSSGVDITLQSFDVYDNPTTSFAGQSLRINVTGNATFVGTGGQNFITATFSNGTASAQVTDQVAETVDLSMQQVNTYFTTNNIDITSTQNLLFDPGAVTNLLINTAAIPSSERVDNSISVQIRTHDQYGNFNSFNDYSNELGVSVSSTNNQSYLAGVEGQVATTLDFVDGVASVTVNNKISEPTSFNLVSSSSGFSLGGGTSLNWIPGNVTFITMQNPNDVTVDDSVTVTLEARDQFCNLNTTFASPNGATIDYSPKNAPETVSMTPAIGNNVTFAGGFATATLEDTKTETIDLTIGSGNLAGSISTTSTCVSPLGVSYPATQDIIFSPGAPTKYQFTESTLISGVNVNVDNPVSVEVKALDQYDNIVTGFNQSNKLTITNDSQTGSFTGVPVSFSAGVGSFQVSDTKSGIYNLGMDLDAGDLSLGIATDSTQIQFDHGAAKQFEINIPVGTYTIDDNMIVEVRALDQYQNFHDNYSGNVTTKTTSSFPEETTSTTKYNSGVSQTFSNGRGNYSISTLKAESTTFRVTAASNNTNGDPMTVNQNDTISFAPGAGTQLHLQPVSITSVDNVATIIINALDRGNNIATSENIVDVARLQISGTGSGSCTLNNDGETSNSTQLVNFDIVSGIGRVDIRCQSVGTYDLQLSNLPSGWTINQSTTQSDGTETIEFTPGVLNKISYVSPTPVSSTADDQFTMNLEGQDQYGNLVTTFNGRVRITNASSSSNVSIPDVGLGQGVVQFTGGAGSLANLQVTQAPQTVSFGLSAVSGTTVPDLTDTADVTISHGAPASISMANVGDKTVGSSATVSITLYDDFGNICTTSPTVGVDLDIISNQDLTSIYINGDDSTGTQNTAAAHTVNVSGGTGNTTLYSTLSQTVTLSLSNPSIALTTGSNKNFKFNPGTATQIGFNSVASTATTDDVVSLEIKAKDQYGNIATSFSSSSVFLTASPSGNLVNPVSGTPIIFTAGEASYDVQNKRPETVVFGFDAGTLGALSTESGRANYTLTVNVGVPDYFGLGTMPTGITVDDTAVATIDVFSYDQWGNLSPTNDDVQINVSGSALFDAVSSNSYPLDFTNDDTVSVTLTDRVAETVQISLTLPTGGMNLQGAVKTMAFKHGLPNNIIFKLPITTTAKTDTPASVELQLRDQYSNLCNTTVGQSVDLSTVTASGIASTVGGTGTQTFSSGKAIYSLTSSTKQIVNMSLSASGLSLPSNQSLSFDWGTPSQISYTTLTGAEVNTTATLIAEVLDGSGNWLREYSGTLEFSQNSFTPTNEDATGNAPSGFGQISSTNGRFTISTITSQQAGSLSVKAEKVSGDGSPSAATGNVAFTPAGASQFYIVPQNGDGIVTGPVTVAVYALDNYWNQTSYNGTATATISQGCGQTRECTGTTANDGFFPPTTSNQSTSVSFSNGSATIDIRKPTTGWTNLAVNAGGMSLINNSGSGEQFYFLPGDPVEYIILDPGFIANGNFHNSDGCSGTSDCHASTDGPVGVEIHAVDLVGTRTATYDGSVEVYISTDPGGTSAYGSKRVNFVQGKATVSIGNSAAETITLSLRDSTEADTTPNSLDTSATLDLKFGKGKVDSIQLSDPPNKIADQSTILYVEAVDENGDIVTSYRGNFDLVASTNVSGRGNFNIVDGVAELEISSYRAGTYALDLADVSGTGLTLDSSSFTVLPKDPNRIPLDCQENVTPTTEERIKCWLYAIDNNHNYVSSWVGSLEVVFEDDSGNIITTAEVWDSQTGGTKLWDADADNDGIYDGQGYVQNWNSDGATKYFWVGNSASQIVYIHTPNGAKADLNLQGGAASPSINTGWARSRFFTPAEAARFDLVTPIADTVAGSSRTITVRAYTESGNFAESYDGYVYVRVVSDPGTSSATVSSGSLVHLIEGEGTIDVSNTEAETIQIALEKIDSTYDGVDLNPDIALSESASMTFVGGTPAKLAILDPGTGTSGMPLTVSVQLQDVAGNPAANDTGSALSINIASDNGDVSVTGSPVSLPNGQHTATFTLSSNTIATANITASHGSYTNASRSISFDIGEVTQLAHTGNYTASDDGTITVELEALSAQGIRKTDYDGVFGVNILNAAANSMVHNSNITINDGIGTIVISSKRAQTVDFNVFDYFGELTMPSNVSLTYNIGIPSKISIATQPVADVPVDTIFTTAPVFRVTDDDGTLISNASDLISLSAFESSGCTNAPNGTLGGMTASIAVSGEVSFTDLTYSVAEEVSIQASADGLTSACTTKTEILGPLALTASPGTSVSVGTVVTITAKGGTQPVTFSMGQNNSGGSLGTPYSCGNSTCVDYTAGPQGGMSFDVINGTDNASTTEFISLMVNGAKLSGTGNVDFGNVDLFIDQSESFSFTNDGNADSGSISVTWTPDDLYAEDESLMWNLNAVGCTGADLTANNGNNCSITLDFLGSSGPGGERDYSGVLTVQGANAGKVELSISAILAPRLTSSPSSYDYGSTAVQVQNTFSMTNIVNNTTTQTLTVALENQAGNDCTGYSILTHNCTTLNDSNSCDATVRFNPIVYGATGTYTCSLTVEASNTEKITIPLTGTKP